MDVRKLFGDPPLFAYTLPFPVLAYVLMYWVSPIINADASYTIDMLIVIACMLPSGALFGKVEKRVFTRGERWWMFIYFMAWAVVLETARATYAAYVVGTSFAHTEESSYFMVVLMSLIDLAYITIGVFSVLKPFTGLFVPKPETTLEFGEPGEG